MKINDINKFYCINLDKRPGKWKAFSEMVKDITEITITHFPGVDGSLWSDDEFKKLNSKNRKRNLNSRKGHLGCSYTHAKIHKDAQDKGYDFICVFEDDCYIKDVENFIKDVNICLSELPDDWGVLFLGGKPYKKNRKLQQYYDYSENLVIAKQVFETHAYICNVNVCSAALINLWEAGYDADVATTTLQKKSDIFYLCNPILCSQRPGYSDIILSETAYHGKRIYATKQKLVNKKKENLF
jgi:glycosyl transferase, family 25